MSNTNDNGQVRPSHYGGPDNPFEPIKIIQHYKLTFECGSAVKYILRAGKKYPGLEGKLADLKKARTSLDLEIEQGEKELQQFDQDMAELRSEFGMADNIQPEESYGFANIAEDEMEVMKIAQVNLEKEYSEYRQPVYDPEYKPLNGAEAIIMERLKQVQKFRFTLENDDTYTHEELALAAMYWALPTHEKDRNGKHLFPAQFWPDHWAQTFARRKEHTRLEQLAIAGALIAAEIDRLKRMEDKTAHADMCEALNLEPARQYKDQIDLYHKISANHPAVPVDENAGVLTDLDIHQMRIAQQEKAEGQPVFDVEAIQKQIDLVNQEQPTPKKYDYRAIYETAAGTPTTYVRRLLKETEDYILLGVWFSNASEIFQVVSAEPVNKSRLQLDVKSDRREYRTWLPIPEGWSEGAVKVVNGYNYWHKKGIIPEAFTHDDKAIRSYLWGRDTLNSTIIRIDNPGKKEAGK